jgi:hypothetical protein
MNLDKYLAIAGVPGIHKLVTSRSNGLVIEDRREGRTRFVPVRQQQVTPLGTVSMYTDSEEGLIPLGDVFQRMLDSMAEVPPAPVEAASGMLRDYFTRIVPEHDQDRVRIADIKKCVKWFEFMLEKGIFDEIKRESEASGEADAESTQNKGEVPSKDV